jgi:hypothetical protein
MICGGLSLAALLAIFLFFAFRMGPGNRDKTESASPKDVRFVLNWCELGDGRIEKVIHSFESSRSLTGDHDDAYAIKINHVEIAELNRKDPTMTSQWYRGDQLPEVVSQAVSFTGWHLPNKKYPWFPPEKDLRSKDFYIYPWSIELHGLQPTSVEIIFIRPSDLMVYYFSGKT